MSLFQFSEPVEG